MKRKVDLEKFYTIQTIAKYCIDLIDLNEYDRIIEPSAGNGSFSNQIKNCEAYDIDPQNENINKKDFLKLNFEAGNILIIGNPPFGRQSSIAIKFINHSANFAKTIAFILPVSFKKESVINKLNKHLFIKKIYDLPKNSFYFNDKIFNIKCSFFIFDVIKDKEREKAKIYTTEDFIFCKRKDADYSIRRVGFFAGKIEGLDVSESSHYFIKDYNNAIETLKNIDYSDLVEMTVGARSISKNEIIKKYIEKKEENND